MRCSCTGCKNKRKTLRVPAFFSVATLNGKSFDIGSVTVYIDKNNTFYLPRHLVEKLKANANKLQ